jgi:steroid delta-isomerase-like uncharacterized protein
MTSATIALVERYYAAFNAGDMEHVSSRCSAMTLLHDINQGGRETGKAAFRAFMARMNRNYREQLADITVMSSACGQRAAAEFTVLGEYLVTDEGLPPARGQTYRLAAGAFFEVRDGKVARISNYYNLQDWLQQVGG